MRILPLGAAALLAIAAAACAGGSEGTGGAGTTTGTGATGGSATGTGGATSASSSTTGTGGAAGTSSSASSSSGSGGAGGAGGMGTGGAGGGLPCHWKSTTNPCGAGMYCDADGCGDGVCVPVGTTEDGTRAPICGCDGVTYWNATVAAKHGMARQTSGACSPAKTCGGITSTPCPAGATCNYQASDKSLCGATDQSGTCWTVPATCTPMVGLGPQTRACGASSCTEECALIQQGAVWYVDTGCPL